MSRRARIQTVLVLLCGLLFCAGNASAQGFPIYKQSLPVASINPDRLFTESLAGRAFLEDLQDRTAALSEENRRIEGELEQEERELTERRQSLPIEEFQELAEAFDQRVVRIRREQNLKANALGQNLDAARRAFTEQVKPVLEQLMRDRGIIFLLEEQAIVLAVSSGDITDEALARVNAEIGTTLDLPE